MARTQIEYKIGMARDGTGPVDYMLGHVVTEEGVIELYAEATIWDSDETGTYGTLRREILEQAVEAGVDVDSLRFYYN